MRNIKRELCICLLLVSLILLVGCGASAPGSGANGGAGGYYCGTMEGNSYLELKSFLHIFCQKHQIIVIYKNHLSINDIF